MTDTASDETLMLLYREGEAGAFDALYARHRGPLYRYLIRQLVEITPAEVLFEDVWMSLISARIDYRPRSDFRCFFYRLTQNRLADYRRRAGHIMGLDEDCFDALPNGIGESRASAAVDPGDALLLEIRDLPDTQREAFLLKEEVGLDLDGIAVVLETDRETAQNRLRAALRRLRSRWASGMPDKGKVVSLLDDVDPLISSAYRDAARETPAPALDEKILAAAHTAIAGSALVTESMTGQSQETVAAPVGWIVAALTAALVAAVFAFKWLPHQSSGPIGAARETEPGLMPEEVAPPAPLESGGADLEFEAIVRLWQSGRTGEAHAAFEVFQESHPDYLPNAADADLYRTLQGYR